MENLNLAGTSVSAGIQPVAPVIGGSLLGTPIPGMDQGVSPAMAQKLIGTLTPAQHNYRYFDESKVEPVPKWDGKDPAKKLRPWLKELRIWRKDTPIPVHKHGAKLAKSFGTDTWMKAIADRIPEEHFFTDHAGN